jgi:5-methylcytosine-specific restriction protein A
VHRPYRIGPPAHRERERRFDQRRGSSRARGYTVAWDAASKDHLRVHPLCLGCEAVGNTTPARLVDHVEPHKGDMAKFWDRTMWQSACRWHHDVVKKRLESLFANGELTVSDLWLNSAAAVAMTRSMRGVR